MYYVRKYNDDGMIRFPLSEVIKKVIGSDTTEENACTHDILCKCETTEDNLDPLTNIGTLHDRVLLEISLAGYAKEDISITKDGNTITVIADRSETNAVYQRQDIKFGKVERKFIIPNEYSSGEVTSTYKDGLLSILIKYNSNIVPIEITDTETSETETSNTEETEEINNDI